MPDKYEIGARFLMVVPLICPRESSERHSGWYLYVKEFV